MGRDCCGGGAPDTEIHLDFMNGTTDKSQSFSHDHGHSHSHDHTHSRNSSSSKSGRSHTQDHSHDHSHAPSSTSIFMDSDEEEERLKRKKEKKEKKEKKLKNLQAGEAKPQGGGLNYSALGLLALFVLPIIFSAGLYIMNIFYPQDPQVQHYKSLIKDCYEVADPKKIDKIDDFLAKYKDREYVILSILTDKYGDKHKACKFKK